MILSTKHTLRNHIDKKICIRAKEKTLEIETVPRKKPMEASWGSSPLFGISPLDPAEDSSAQPNDSDAAPTYNSYGKRPPINIGKIKLLSMAKNGTLCVKPINYKLHTESADLIIESFKEIIEELMIRFTKKASPGLPVFVPGQKLYSEEFLIIR